MSVQDEIVARINAEQHQTGLGPLTWSAENDPLTILKTSAWVGQDDLSAVTSRLPPTPGLYLDISIWSNPGSHAVDTFKWRLVTNDPIPDLSAEVDITGSVQELQPGLTVKFDHATGHSGNESWVVKLDGELAVPATIRTGRRLFLYEEPGSDNHGSEVTFAAEGLSQWTQWTTNGGTIYGPVWQFLSTRGTFDNPADAHDGDFLGQIWFTYQRNGANVTDAVITGQVLSVADRIAQLILSASGGVVIGHGPVPANAAAPGTAGQISWDADFLYLCVAANSWTRVAIAAW